MAGDDGRLTELTEPETWEGRAWNGVFPSARQLWVLARYMATPARSAKYGQRLNAWRIATGREPYTEQDIAAVREMLTGRRGR